MTVAWNNELWSFGVVKCSPSAAFWTAVRYNVKALLPVLWSVYEPIVTATIT